MKKPEQPWVVRKGIVSDDERVMLELAVMQKNYHAAWQIAAPILDRFTSEVYRLTEIEEAASAVILEWNHHGLRPFMAPTLSNLRNVLQDARRALT